MSEAKRYQDALIRHGIGLPADPSVLGKLARRFEISAREGLSGSDVNLVVAAAPEVAQVVSLGFLRSKKEAVLALPPALSVLNAVRDALWFEADAATRHWANGTHRILSELQAATHETDLALGPRSPICHQDKVFAGTLPGIVFDRTTKPSSKAFGQHPHDDWLRIRAALSAEAGFLEPSFLSFDLCLRCGETANSTTRLGLPVIGGCVEHAHEWRDFAVPVPDAHGFMGRLTGQVCVFKCGSDNERPGRCLETRSLTLEVGRAVKLPDLPAWVKEDDSVLRPVLACPKSHRHLWSPGRVALGGGSNLMTVRCVLCDAEYWSNKIYGESVPELMRELRRRVKAAGGFAQAPAEELRRIQRDMRPKWGPYLGWFGDALAMITCQSGRMRAATEAEREKAASYVDRGKAIIKKEIEDFVKAEMKEGRRS